MKNKTLSAAIVIACSLLACNSKDKTLVQQVDSIKEDVIHKEKSLIALFEIPATDISRAISFYQSILNIEIEKMDMPGMEMGIMPYENQTVTGVIMKGEGYIPSSDGVTIYLNGGDDLQLILEKVEKNGGKVILPKTAHADENGYFALFLDTEGNKLGLNSPN